MSTNDNLAQPIENPPEQPITIQPSAMAMYPASDDWSSGGAVADSQQQSMGGAAFLHALRRHWLLSLSLGIACAVVAGTVILLLQKPLYTATATIILSPREETIMGASADGRQDQLQGEFDIFRETQQNLVRHRFVLAAALRNPKMKNLASIQREDADHNALNWLGEKINVSFLGKSAGFMQVSMTLPDRYEAAQIVNAIVEAYSDEAANDDLKKRRVRLGELQKLFAEKESDLRTKRTELTQTRENLGAGDEKSTSLKAQLAMQNYGDLQRQFTMMKIQRDTIQRELKENEAARNATNSLDVSEGEITMALQGNQEFQALHSRQNMIEQILKNQSNLVLSNNKPSSASVRARDELDSVKSQLMQLRAQFSVGVKNARNLDLERKHLALITDQELYVNLVGNYQNEAEKAKKEAENIGKSFVEVQMMQADVENIEHLLKGVAEERERVKVELRSQARVKVLGDPPADVPDMETGRTMRMTIIALGALLAACVPAVGIVLWDLRQQRVNAASDISHRLRIPVIGSVPKIPASVMRRLGASTRKNQMWRMRFTESVDSVTARLLRKAECEQSRVVLITSAISGEGKTTLATQLAMSLARNRRRTLLIDFDLRRPTLDGALGLAAGPGVCEALRGQGDILSMVQATATDGLSAIVAGRWDRGVLSALTNGSVATIVEQLRANFEFVIIDSSPLLPIVDTRLVCQHVDAVVLSVLRDVSQGPKIQAAQEILEAFGVRSVEAVVTGGTHHGGGKNFHYESSALSDAEVLAPGEELSSTHGAGHSAESESV